MQKFTTVIIGAGPAGLACATELAGNGVDVLVLEKNSIIGPKVCGGGITWGGLSKRIPDHLIEKPFTRQHLHTALQHVTVVSDTPIISTVDRGKLGRWMLEQASAAGAVVKAGTYVKKITPEHVEFTDKEQQEKTCSIGYNYLIGADGSNSLVRRYLNLETANPGVGIHYELPYSLEKMEWHLNTKQLGKGYGWVFPHRQTTSFGIYGIQGAIPSRQLLKKLIDWADKKSINLAGLQPRAGLINHDYRGWRFGNKLLIGDAAGLASPLTGEGIYPAIISAEAAARSILHPGYSSEELNKIIKKQKKHRQVIDFSGKNSLLCATVMEIFALALKSRLISFDELEMTPQANI
jgi:geranylgeranyl reductase